MPVCRQLVHTGQVFADEMIPGDGTLHMMRNEVPCLIDVISTERSFVSTQHILIVWCVC